jgi:hypothetical protein
MHIYDIFANMEKCDNWIVASPKIAGWAMSLEISNKKILDKQKVMWIKAPSTFFFTSFFSRTINAIKVENRLNKELNLTSENFIKVNKRIPYLSALYISLKFTFSFYFFNRNNIEFFDQKRNIPIGKIIATNTSRLRGRFIIENYPISLKHNFEIISEIYQTFIHLEKISKKYGYPKLILFPNGRCMTGSSVFCFARKNKIRSNGYENGFKAQSWEIFENSPHYPPDWWEKLKCKKVNPNQKRELLEYLTVRSKGIEKRNNIDWRINFDIEKLPSNLKEKYVTFFTSSSHEMQPFDEWIYKGSFFQNQIEAVRHLKVICAKFDYQLVIRRHPNSVSISGEDFEEALWNEFKFDVNILYLPPNSRVDSYALLKKSLVVFTHESMIGIESIFLEKPTYATGPAYWAASKELRAWTPKRMKNILQEPKIYKGSILFKWAQMMLNDGENLKVFDFYKDNVAVFRNLAVYYQESILRKILR